MAGEDFCRIERHGDVIILVVSPEVETLSWELIEYAAGFIMEPIRKEACPLLLVDLTGVDYFGSVFLSLLLRCWKHVTTTGGMMVIAGASTKARELLRVTALDSLWALYDSRKEAIQALEAD